MKKSAVLFDLDGTLLDTTDGVLESAVHAAVSLGCEPLPHETMLHFVGPPIQESFMRYYGMDKAGAQEAANIFRSYYKENALFKAKPYPGLIETLKALSSNGMALGVATYKREDYAIKVLQHFAIAQYCKSMHGADNFNRLTKADIVEMCIGELGVDRKEVVLVGDTEHDAVGAVNAGVDFIGVTFGFGFKTESDIGRYPNIGCINSLEEIVELIV
jgi:phosphoglycolate phosphatase